MIIGEKNIYKERIMKIIKKNKNFSFLIGNKKKLIQIFSEFKLSNFKCWNIHVRAYVFRLKCFSTTTV